MKKILELRNIHHSHLHHRASSTPPHSRALRPPSPSPPETPPRLQPQQSYVAQVRDLTGDAFPIVHRRTCIAHPIPTPRWSGSNTPATGHPGSPFDNDVTNEMTFDDHAAYERFMAKVAEPEIARRLQAAESRFMDHSVIAMAVVREVMETRKVPEWFRGVGERYLW
ncbi:hypothetical protein BDW74DRAFT_181791 [Aspergillus multicolor]|uniref:EthD domain-containing protein n=1 Tax=Aspergillus multicolor TaxID=41759 RepID=UPI003CCE2BE9